MALTADDVEQLERALATGTLRVRFPDNREVQYRSLAEMREVLRMARASAAGGPLPRGHSVAGF